jgi:hypothetical protein
MKTVTEATPVEEFTEKLPEVYMAEKQEEILLEPGDIVISTMAGWYAVLDALVKHAREHIGEQEWTAQSIVNELNKWV